MTTEQAKAAFQRLWDRRQRYRAAAVEEVGRRTAERNIRHLQEHGVSPHGEAYADIQQRRATELANHHRRIDRQFEHSIVRLLTRGVD